MRLNAAQARALGLHPDTNLNGPKAKKPQPSTEQQAAARERERQDQEAAAAAAVQAKKARDGNFASSARTRPPARSNVSRPQTPSSTQPGGGCVAVVHH